MILSWLRLLHILASVLTSALGLRSSWCDNNEAQEVFDRTRNAMFLPSGGIDMIDYAFDLYRNWFISAKELATGEYRLWRIASDGSTRTVLLNVKADAIAVMDEATGVFTIEDNRIQLHSRFGVNPVDQVGSPSPTWSGLYYDDEEGALYASDSENNRIVRFIESSPTFWDSEVVISGQGNGSRKLDKPAGIRKFGNTLYIVETGGRANTVVSWHIGSSKRNFKFSFNPTGKFGIDVWDGYIFYRSGDDAVYRKSLYSPGGKSELVVGGCGAGSDMNQITNNGTGALRGYFKECDLIVWDFTLGANRFVEWDDSWCSAPAITAAP